MKGLRSTLYRLAALLGWFNAAEKGPAALLRRAARVEGYKATSKLINRLTRPSRASKD